MGAAQPQKVLFSWAFADGTTGQVMLDASISEHHVAGATVSDHRVESGGDISDNIEQTPDKLTIEGVITNTPLGVPTTQADGVSGSLQNTGSGPESFRAFKYSGQFDRVRDAHGDILDALKGGALFTVTTTLKRYEKLAVVNYPVTRTAEKGNALFFTCDFKTVRIVDSQTVAALPPKAQKQHRGAKPTKPLDAKKDQPKIDTLTKVVDLLVSAFK